MSELPESPTWISEEEADDWEEEDDCITGNHFFAFGSEDCEFCIIGAECKALTLQHESMRGVKGK